MCRATRDLVEGEGRLMDRTREASDVLERADSRAASIGGIATVRLWKAIRAEK